MIDMDEQDGLQRLELMLRIRRFEEKCAELYSAEKIRGFLHLSIGEEAVSAGAFSALKVVDSIVTTYREHGHALARGLDARKVMAEMFGKQSGCARGRGGSMHLFAAAQSFYGGYAIVGGGLPVAVGLALADKLQRTERVTACFFGDGATDEGEFHEALNLAALWHLPVLFLCENNYYAMGTALARHAADTDLLHAPAGHKIPAESVDGMDVVAVERATRYAADLVRSGEGPRFLELRTYRFRAHSMYDPERYRSKDEVNMWKERDPIALFSSRLREAGMLDDAKYQVIERRVAKEIEDAVQFAEQSELEPERELTRFVYAEEP